MPCYHPLEAYQIPPSGGGTTSKIVFSKSQTRTGIKIKLPCGQCVGCRLEKSRQWAIRCMHEASTHQDNCFITLTYDNDNLPSDHSLHHRHFQLFMKRLRKHFSEKKFKFYMCGEYGEPTPENDYIARPHYHACLFGLDFNDKILWKQENGYDLYISEILTKIWAKGHCSIGTMTFESAAYCARYILKKIKGKDLEKLGENGLYPYEKYSPDGLEIYKLQPEYSRQSRGGSQKGSSGIGASWITKWKNDTYPSDTVIKEGKEFKPPQYYDYVINKTDPETINRVKEKRKQKNTKNLKDQTPERLRTREKVKLAQIENLKRKL